MKVVAIIAPTQEDAIEHNGLYGTFIIKPLSSVQFSYHPPRWVWLVNIGFLLKGRGFEEINKIGYLVLDYPFEEGIGTAVPFFPFKKGKVRYILQEELSRGVRHDRLNT